MATDTSTIERRPRVKVLLSPGLPRENQLPQAAVGRGLGAIDITPFLTSARTSKTMQAPNGSWELRCTFAGLQEIIPELTEKRALNLVTVPHNFVDIAFDAGVKGSEMQTVMQGPVLSIAAKEVISPRGRPQREVVLCGEDWGHYLVRHQLAAHQFTAYLQSQGELDTRTEFGALVRGTVGAVEQRIFDAIFVQRVGDLQLQFQKQQAGGKDGLFIIDIDKGLYEQSSGVIWQGSLWHRQGSFWTSLKSLADEPWNEIYGDYDPSYVKQGPGDGLTYIAPSNDIPSEAPERHFVIRLRHRPFDKQRWEVLPTHEVRDDELLYQQHVLADDERCNWILIEITEFKNTTEQDFNMATYAIRRFDALDASRHGARQMRFSTPYVDQGEGRGGESLARDPKEQAKFLQRYGKLFTLADLRATTLWNMYNINHRLVRSSLVIPGRPEIRIGHRVANQRDPSPWFVKEEAVRRVGYVEQVVHDYVVAGERFTTHLGLTRGQPVDGFIEPWTKGTETESGGGTSAGGAGSRSDITPQGGGPA